MNNKYIVFFILITLLLLGCEQSNKSAEQKKDNFSQPKQNSPKIISNTVSFSEDNERSATIGIAVKVGSDGKFQVSGPVRKELHINLTARDRPSEGDNPDFGNESGLFDLAVKGVKYVGDLFSSDSEGEPATSKDKHLTFESAREHHQQTENLPHANRSKSTEETEERYRTLEEAKEKFDIQQSAIEETARTNITELQAAKDRIERLINNSASDHIENVNAIIVEAEDIIAVAESLPERQFKTDPNSALGREIRNLNNLANYAQRRLDGSQVPEKATRQQLLNMAREATNLADQYADSGQIEEYKAAKEIAAALLDVALSVTPIVGWVKDVHEAYTGKNIFGENLSDFERISAWVGAVTGGVGSKVVGSIGYAAVVFTKIGKKIDQSAEFADVLKQGNKIVDSAKRTGEGAQDAISFATSLSKNADEVIAVIDSTVAVGVTSGSRVKAAANVFHDYLGNIDRLRINRAGDRIFLSLDGKRKVRFDINNPHGDIPHMHLQKLDAAGNWVDEVGGKHRIRFDGN